MGSTTCKESFQGQGRTRDVGSVCPANDYQQHEGGREHEKSGESGRQEVLPDLRRDEKNAGGSGQRAPLDTGQLGRAFLRCQFYF